MKRDTDIEATIVGKFVVMSPLLDERARRLWAAAESVAIGYGGDALVSSATGLARETIRNGRRELAEGVDVTGRIRRPGAGRPGIEQTQPGLTDALEAEFEGQEVVVEDVTVSSLTVPTVGEATVAFRGEVTLSVEGDIATFFADVVLIIDGRAELSIEFFNQDEPFDPALQEQLIQKVGDKLAA